MFVSCFDITQSIPQPKHVSSISKLALWYFGAVGLDIFNPDGGIFKFPPSTYCGTNIRALWNGTVFAVATDKAYLVDAGDVGAFGKPSPVQCVSLLLLSLPVDAAVAAMCSN